MDIGPYELANQIPGGRYGAIWKARDRHGGRWVALKQLALAGPERRARIRSQADALARLTHPNLARTYPPVEDATSIWLVEDWVDGISMSVVAGTGQLSLWQSLGLLRGALEGLATAHAAGLVHGNVSPRTIFVSPDGEPLMVEFGAWLGQPDAAGIGPYASPEATAHIELGPTADVYSAGSILSEVLHTRGGQAVASSAAVGVTAADPTAELRQIATRATSANPSQRQPDALALLDELDSAGQRAFGPAWWTTEGIAAIVAAVTGGALMIGTGATAVSAAQLVPSGPVAGAALVGGAGSLARGSGKLSGKLIGVIAGAMALVVVGVGAFALFRNQAIVADPAPQNAPTSSTGSGSLPPPTAGPTASSTSSAPTPKPTPKPPANALQAFAGTYRYVAVVTKAVGATNVSVGKTYTYTWKVRTSCRGTACTTTATTNTKGRVEISSALGGCCQTTNAKYNCYEVKTGKKQAKKVNFRYSRTLKVATTANGVVTKLVGDDRERQTQPCTNQVGKKYDVRTTITITLLKR